MNNRKLLIQRNKIRQMIEMSNRHKDVLKWSPTETDAHIQMKLEICKYLKKEGHEFYVEAIFAGRKGRADIVDADIGVAIEVVDSEIEASLIAKANIYPLPLIIVGAKQSFKPELIQ